MYTTLIDAKKLRTLMASEAPLKLYDCSVDLMDRALGRARYEQGHIPGAIHADLEVVLALDDPEGARVWSSLERFDLDTSGPTRCVTVMASLQSDRDGQHRVYAFADAASVLEDMIAAWKARSLSCDGAALSEWWRQIEAWRARNSFRYAPSADSIKPQYAIERLYALTRDKDVYITTEVGQHQMWAAQFFHFEEPNRWMTSGGLGTMGYGLPAAVGVQLAHPGSLVIDIGGDASVQMTMQEMSTAIQYGLPIKIFILNNEWMGMVRQWQQLLHGERYSHSYSASLPDFVKMAEAFGCLGLRARTPAELDDAIRQMIDYPGPVIFDCCVTKEENCFPMIPSGKAHNDMILAEETRDLGSIIDDAGKRLV